MPDPVLPEPPELNLLERLPLGSAESFEQGPPEADEALEDGSPKCPGPRPARTGPGGSRALQRGPLEPAELPERDAHSGLPKSLEPRPAKTGPAET